MTPFFWPPTVLAALPALAVKSARIPWLVGLLLAGCASAPPTAKAPTPAAAPLGAASQTVTVPRTIVTATSTSNVTELLAEAAALAEAGRYREAAAAYERVYALDADGPSAFPALLGAADAYDQVMELEPALSRYELAARREPDSTQARHALVRASRILTFLGRYARAGELADGLLPAIEALGPYERVAVFSAKALSLTEKGDDVRASYFIEKGRDVIESHALDSAGRVPRDLAQLFYALGEARRLRAERIVFDPPPANFGGALEARCVLLLEAQGAYSDTMRAYDAHWSAMAGYRVAELYQRLHADLMVVKPPAGLSERESALFAGAVRTRYAVLLTKAHGMAEHTLAMAEREGEHSQWVERTREALLQIDRAVAEEQAALARSPYRREEFEAYFSEREKAAGAAAVKAKRP